MDADNGDLVARARDFGQPGAPVEEEQHGNCACGLESGREKESSELELFAAAGGSFLLEAEVSPGVLHHGRGILRLLRESRTGAEEQEDRAGGQRRRQTPNTRVGATTLSCHVTCCAGRCIQNRCRGR